MIAECVGVSTFDERGVGWVCLDSCVVWVVLYWAGLLLVLVYLLEYCCLCIYAVNRGFYVSFISRVCGIVYLGFSCRLVLVCFNGR